MEKTVNEAVEQFDRDEAANREQAVENGFTKEQLEIADRDIADERKNVEAGLETAEQAEDVLNDRITRDVLDDAGL